MIPRDYIYFYSKKFGLRRRRAFTGYKHRYKKKQMGLIDFDDFIERFEKLPSDTFQEKRIRSFNALLYWTGLRQSEARGLVASDFKVRGDNLLINFVHLNKGRGVAEGQRFYPLDFHLNWLFLGEIVGWVKRFKDYERPWNMSRTTAIRYVKAVYPEGYPDCYHVNKVRSMCEDGRFSLAEISSLTGLHASTLESYISRGRRFAS